MGILDELAQPTGPSMLGGYGASQPSILDSSAAYNPMGNLAQAHAALDLTPQEKALYQRHLTNLWGNGGVDNPDGSRSTLYQLSTDIGGKTYNLPTVYDGSILDPDAAIQRAKTAGLGQFPSYANGAEAEKRYQAMHQFMDKDTGAYMQMRGRR